MFYEFKLTVPRATTPETAVREELQLDKGVVTMVELLFPPGCFELVHLRVERETHVVFPSNADGFIAGDTFPIRWSEELEVLETPFALQAVAWNEDQDFDHAITIRFEFTPDAVWQQRREALAALGYLAAWWRTGGQQPA